MSIPSFFTSASQPLHIAVVYTGCGGVTEWMKPDLLGTLGCERLSTLNIYLALSLGRKIVWWAKCLSRKLVHN